MIMKVVSAIVCVLFVLPCIQGCTGITREIESKPKSRMEYIAGIACEGHWTLYIVRVDDTEYVVNPDGGILHHQFTPDSIQHQIEPITPKFIVPKGIEPPKPPDSIYEFQEYEEIPSA